MCSGNGISAGAATARIAWSPCGWKWRSPYYMTKLELDQLPPKLALDRVTFLTLPGGHMFYIRDASRQAFREAASKLYR